MFWFGFRFAWIYKSRICFELLSCRARRWFCRAAVSGIIKLVLRNAAKIKGISSVTKWFCERWNFQLCSLIRCVLIWISLCVDLQITHLLCRAVVRGIIKLVLRNAATSRHPISVAWHSGSANGEIFNCACLLIRCVLKITHLFWTAVMSCFVRHNKDITKDILAMNNNGQRVGKNALAFCVGQNALAFSTR